MKLTSRNFKSCLAVAGLALVMLAGRISPAATIRLRAQAVVEAHQDVRLGDIATVTDADPRKAEDLANTVVLSGVEKDQKLGAESILMALMAQRGVSSLGSDLRMGGAVDCRISIGTPAARAAVPAAPVSSQNTADIASTPVRAMGAAETAGAPVSQQPAGQAIAQSGAKAATPGSQNPSQAPADGRNLTLSQLITQQVQTGLNGSSENVRIVFESINPLLDTQPAGDRKWLCRPLTKSLLGTVSFEAQLVEGAKIFDRLNVQARVVIRQRVVVATRRVVRGDVIAEGQVAMEDQWLDRKLPKLFELATDVVGLEAVRDVDVGGILDQRDFREALMAHKNEPVNVIYVAGSMQVQISGRAMDDGKLHDRIDVRNESTGERYDAVMIGRNLAVAGGTLTAAQEKKLQESQQ